jgi:hypothetical protein
MCPHLDMSKNYTVRHNAAEKELTKGIRGAKPGRWLTITSFGKIDGLTGDPETVPEWMLSEGGRNRVDQPVPDDAGDTRGPMTGGIGPDTMIMENWAEARPPQGGPPPLILPTRRTVEKLASLL